MIYPLSLTMCFWFGFTNPNVEQSILDLESRVFLQRHRATTYLCNNGSSFVLRVLVAASVKDTTLERQRRLDNIKNHLKYKFIKEYEEWWERKWKFERQVAELLVGSDWPSINMLYFWDLSRDPILSLERQCFPRYFCKGKSCKDNDIGYKVATRYWYSLDDPNTTQSNRLCYYFREFFPHEYDPHTRLWKMRGSWEHARTKMWIVDELYAGIDPRALSLALIVMRARDIMETSLLDKYHDLCYTNILFKDE